MTDHDPIADLADRIRERQRRGEDWEFEFAIDFGSLTDDEQDEYIALIGQRNAHAEERLGALDEDRRVLVALASLVAFSDAPPGTKLGEALTAGYVGVMDVVSVIRGAVTDAPAAP